MKIIVETLAKSCLDNIFNYNMQYSSKNALEVDKNIRAQINNLNKFSYLGKLIPEMSDSHFREIIYKNLDILDIELCISSRIMIILFIFLILLIQNKTLTKF